MSRAAWLREMATRPCPPWCSRVAGHPLRVEVAGTAQRTHVLAYGPVTLRQVETARGDGVRLGPVEVTTDGLDAADVTMARAASRGRWRAWSRRWGSRRGRGGGRVGGTRGTPGG